MEEQVPPNATPVQQCRALQAGKGVKNGHSPWSAPRERKRRSKAVAVPVAAAPAAELGAIEEIESYASPPKRAATGGNSPAARELALSGQEPPHFAIHDVLGLPAEAATGPLAQGLFASPLASGAAGDESFSPLASGLRAPSFTAASPASSPQQQQQQQQPPRAAGPGAGGERQRKQLRQAAAFRMAAARQRQQQPSSAAGQNGSIAGPSAPAAAAAPEPAQLPPGPFCVWQPPAAAAAPAPGQPFGLGVPLPGLQSSHSAPVVLYPEEAPCRPADLPAAARDEPSRFAPVPAAAPPAQLPQQQPAEAAPLPEQHLLPPPLSLPLPAAARYDLQAAGPSSAPQRCSTGQDMETDLRSSWGSDRSADVSSWRELQSRLHAEIEAGGPLGAAAVDVGNAAAGLPGGLHGDAAMLRASAEGGAVPSVRSSLDGGPSCTERQHSTLPLRAGVRPHQWHSHLQGVDGASPDPLLGSLQGPSSSGGSKHRTRSGGTTKWGCFSCASPFSCRQRPSGEESDDEVVRRNDSSDGFVIRRKQSLTPPSPAARSGGGTAPRLKRASLNQPPEDEPAELVHRQQGFSAHCGATPRSPGSEGPNSDDSFSLVSGPPGLRSGSLCRSVGLRDASIEELAGGLGGGGGEGGGEGGEGAGTPTVDALNDMLKALSLCPSAHPKDAEELVARACQTHSIQPNITTARTLEKMWAVHDQLYG